MIANRSQFYFGTEITLENYYLNFKEGAGPELTAILTRGYYSLTDFVDEIERALNEAGALTYTVTFNRTTRIINIAATGTFTLLASTGTNVGNSAYSLMGYAAINVTGTSLSGGSGAGYSYRPQYPIQDYVKPGQRQESVDATINETGSGRVEVVKFGLRSFVEMNLRFITSIPQGGAIENNYTGYEDAQFFMEEITKRGDIEFMEDRDIPGTFYKISLQSTESDSKGLGFKLIEEPALGYYRTGKLVFRVIED